MLQKNEFSYGGIESNVFHITCDCETHSILPALRSYTQEVPGMDGVVDYEIGGYQTRIISVPIYFDGDYADLRANREAIVVWLSNDGKPKELIFGNQPDRYYKAKIFSELNFTNTNSRLIATIEFECNPPWQYSQSGILLTPEQLNYSISEIDNNQFIKSFSENGTMRFVNKGSAPVKPILKIIGYIAPGTILTYNGKKIILNSEAIYDGIAVDCKNETVVRMSDNANYFEYLDLSSEFFSLESGNCEIEFFQPEIDDFPKCTTVIVQFDAEYRG